LTHSLSHAPTAVSLDLAERGWLPDAVLRIGIRRLVRARLAAETARAGGDPARAERDFAAQLTSAPIALVPEKANEQHYEVPPAFFRAVLGPRLKYSCGYFAAPSSDLAQAEERSLELVCERAELRDGIRILDLGCGWGSLSLFVAEHFPSARIVAVSNSSRQREHILAECARRGLAQIEVVTADVTDFEPAGLFDRVVSVEMFEHVRNWAALLARIERWLTPAGKLFVHVFCHRDLAYAFEVRGSDDWMARRFFSGGIMPSAGLIRRFERELRVECEWRIAGTHYARTAEAWLANLDRDPDTVLRILRAGSGAGDAARALRRWRLFFMAVAELFGAADGAEWQVAQYLLSRAPRAAAAR
jgi:cyclopropane-fatty-acyl-phospholipid synthase